MLNNPADVLSIVLRGTLGRSGRKRARRASRFITGNRGFLSASSILAAAGVAWGIYDSYKGQEQGPSPGVPATPGAPQAPQGVMPAFPLPVGPAVSLPETVDPVERVIRLAISAAKADGQLSEHERALIVERAREAGVESIVDAELNHTRPLAEIVRGVSDPALKRELYVLAFAIVRADETVSGAERIYLAQLAHQLGLEPSAVQALEADTAAQIDAQPEN